VFYFSSPDHGPPIYRYWLAFSAHDIVVGLLSLHAIFVMAGIATMMDPDR
jgi:hypothetical protein